MKNLYSLIFMLVIMTVSTFSNAQSNFTLKWRASKNMKKSQFEDALFSYKKLLKRDSTVYLANYNAAQIYLYEFEIYDSAEVHLNRILVDKNKDTIVSSLYHYGHCLRMQEKPEEALSYLNAFKSKYLVGTNKMAPLTLTDVDREIAYCEQSISMPYASPKKILVDNIGFTINSQMSEYTPVYISTDCTLVYNGRYKDSKEEDQFRDDEYMENIYYYDLEGSVSSVYDQSIGQKDHFAVVSKNRAKNEFIIYRKNKLAIAKMEEGKIQKPVGLPSTITNFYRVAHGMLSATSDTIIFSAKQTIEDDLDIYMSTRSNDGPWSDPVPLPPTINSEMDEDSPLLLIEGKTLYFSSKGHNSSGGYDVFKSVYEDGKWKKATPLPYPINSAGDDIYMDLSTDGEFGYISSNRDNGFGRMDIYSIDFDPIPVFDCDTFINRDIFVTLSIAEILQIEDDANYDYRWTFENNQVMDGSSVLKQFDYPGKYPVKIDIINKTTKEIETAGIEKEITIDDKEFVGFTSQDAASIEEMIAFNGGATFVEDHQIINYDWKVDEKILKIHDPVLNYAFKELGEHLITMQVDILNMDEKLLTYCYYKNIEIFEKDSIPTTPIDLFAEDSTGTSNTNGTSATSGTNNTSGTDIAGNNPDKTNSLSDLSFKDMDDTYGLILKNGFDTLHFKIIYFDFDKTDLKQRSIKELNQLISYLDENPEELVVLEGHTDAMGGNIYNKMLSQRRATKAQKYLLNKGISKKRIVKTLSYGEEQPAAPNVNPDGSDSIKGRSKNRRVEFIIVK